MRRTRSHDVRQLRQARLRVPAREGKPRNLATALGIAASCRTHLSFRLTEIQHSQRSSTLALSKWRTAPKSSLIRCHLSVCQRRDAHSSTGALGPSRRPCQRFQPGIASGDCRCAGIANQRVRNANGRSRSLFAQQSACAYSSRTSQSPAITRQSRCGCLRSRAT